MPAVVVDQKMPGWPQWHCDDEQPLAGLISHFNPAITAEASTGEARDRDKRQEERDAGLHPLEKSLNSPPAHVATVSTDVDSASFSLCWILPAQQVTLTTPNTDSLCMGADAGFGR